MSLHDRHPLGVTPLDQGRCAAVVWAPAVQRVVVALGAEGERRLELEPGARGYHSGILDDVRPGLRYALSLDGGPPRPDPASRLQPDGPHGASEVVGREFSWTDGAWRPPPFDRLVFYELHVGTFTPRGTFEGVIERLDDLRELGVNAIELMPVSQFPGGRNWGYDGVLPFAAQNTYGGPEGLRRLVDAAHARGIGVYLDVVYNHLGPEGNYLAEFGPYFTDRYTTPWGRAINFDGAGADEVRRYFIESALYWVTDCHIDGLRLDAVHAIIDPTAVHFLEELASAVHRRGEELGRRIDVIAETALNDPRLVRPRETGGYGLDAQWNDDFHHAVVACVQSRGLRYQGYGEIGAVEKVLTDGYFFTGQHSEFHGRRHGRPSRDVPAPRFLVFVQNHDQVGNQRAGERLTDIATFEAAKLAAGLMLLSPYVPLLFMGEEHAEPAPFLYFVSHTDPELIEAVRKGRAEEFRAYGWGDGNGEGPPDPASPETFRRSVLHHELKRADGGPHRGMYEYYRALLRLRREAPALASLSKDTMRVDVDDRQLIVSVRRWTDAGGLSENQVLVVANFTGESVDAAVRAPAGSWERLIDSAADRFAGPGAASAPEVDSDGLARVALAPHSLAAYSLRST